MSVDLRPTTGPASDLVTWLASAPVQTELAPYIAAINASLGGGHTLAPVREWVVEHDHKLYPTLRVFVMPGPSITRQVTRGTLDREYEAGIVIGCKVYGVVTNDKVDPLNALCEAIAELAFNIDLGEQTVSQADYTGPDYDLLRQGLFWAWIGINAGPDDDG